MTSQQSAVPYDVTARLDDSPYRTWRLHWARYGVHGWRLLDEHDREVGVAIRVDRAWSFLPAGHSKPIRGMASLRACKEFFVRNIATSPFWDDPSVVSHAEWSVDGKTWHRQDPDTEALEPKARYFRWVGVSHAFELARTEPEETS